MYLRDQELVARGENIAAAKELEKVIFITIPEQHRYKPVANLRL